MEVNREEIKKLFHIRTDLDLGQRLLPLQAVLDDDGKFH